MVSILGSICDNLLSYRDSSDQRVCEEVRTTVHNCLHSGDFDPFIWNRDACLFISHNDWTGLRSLDFRQYLLTPFKFLINISLK